MILKLQDRARNADILEVDAVSVRRFPEHVVLNYVDLDGRNQQTTINADTGWTRAYLMDKGTTFDAIKHDPSLL
jgi:hypothetical protein